jgi:hypothetical protein
MARSRVGGAMAGYFSYYKQKRERNKKNCFRVLTFSGPKDHVALGNDSERGELRLPEKTMY